MNRIGTALQALRELGPQPLALVAWHRLGLRTGLLRRQTPPGSPPQAGNSAGGLRRGWLPLPDRQALADVLGEQATALLAEADEIAGGRVRLFGGPPVPLQLTSPGPLRHWTAYEGGLSAGEIDIKWTWEPARFGWAFTLARAYHLNGNERFPAAFWNFAETFLEANPPNLGPNWASAQEVALRMMAFAFAAEVFSASPHTTPARLSRLAQAVAQAAERIPPTLAYARSQNNNHLLTEAAGLLTAALLLHNHPQAARWRRLGWRWLNAGLQAQIASDGAYAQHSTNYHRLMLHAALWGAWMGQQQGLALREETLRKLAQASRWLLALVEPGSGRVPNLGPNDGALILPLAACAYGDYRPALQAAAAAFLNEHPFSPGPWDEALLWLKVDGFHLKGERQSKQPSTLNPQFETPAILRNPADGSWAYLRAARFTSRPGHSDQLHLDLWWRGLNVAQDAGTFSYNSPPPWDNGLSGANVHNTVLLNGRDPMRRAGRFLFLEWAQGRIVANDRAPGASHGGLSVEHDGGLSVEHDGYRRQGVTHRRKVEYNPQGWAVTDWLLPLGGRSAPAGATASLHWLLPDWPWELDEAPDEIDLRLHSPLGMVQLSVRTGTDIANGLPLTPRLTRAGEVLYGCGPAAPVEGWVSPTYGYKAPALSLTVTAQGALPLALVSAWRFPNLPEASQSS